MPLTAIHKLFVWKCRGTNRNMNMDWEQNISTSLVHITDTFVTRIHSFAFRFMFVYILWYMACYLRLVWNMGLNFMKLLFPLSYIATDDLTLEQLQRCNGMWCLCSRVVNLIHLPSFMTMLLYYASASFTTQSDPCKVPLMLCLNKITYEAFTLVPGKMDDERKTLHALELLWQI